MRVDREALVAHLKKIHCGGRVDQVVLSDAFQATAFTVDQNLLVIAPNVAESEPLPHPIGVFDVARLIGSLGDLAGEGNRGAYVDVSIQDGRLVLDEGERGVIRLRTAALATISTRVQQDTVDRILANFANKPRRFVLRQDVVEGVKRTFSRLKVESVEVQVGPGDVWITVGDEFSDVADIPLLGTVGGEIDHTLALSPAFISVLTVLTTYSAELLIAGPERPVLIEEEGYRYVISAIGDLEYVNPSFWRKR